MPIYEYQCHPCGERFELLQRLGEGAEKATCPRCDGHDLERLHSTFAAASGGAKSESQPCMPAGCCGGGACGPGGWDN